MAAATSSGVPKRQGGCAAPVRRAARGPCPVSANAGATALAVIPSAAGRAAQPRGNPSSLAPARGVAHADDGRAACRSRRNGDDPPPAARADVLERGPRVQEPRFQAGPGPSGRTEPGFAELVEPAGRCGPALPTRMSTGRGFVPTASPMDAAVPAPATSAATVTARARAPWRRPQPRGRHARDGSPRHRPRRLRRLADRAPGAVGAAARRRDAAGRVGAGRHA